jgi:hypothetical protein
MEASAFGTPVTPEQPVRTEAPAEQPVEQVAPVQPAAPEQPVAPAAPEDPILSAINGLSERLDTALPQQPVAEEPDLLAALMAEPEVEQPTQPQVPEPQAGDQEAEQQLAELQSFVRAEAQELITPYIREQKEERIRGLQQKYPDIGSKEILPGIESQMAEMIQETGNDDLRYNDKLVEKIYRMVKAEQAETNGAAAETVVNQGASLETNAGHTQAGTPTNDDDYRSQVYGNQPTRSVFAGG